LRDGVDDRIAKSERELGRDRQRVVEEKMLVVRALRVNKHRSDVAAGSGPPTAGSAVSSNRTPASAGAATFCVPMSMPTDSCALGTRQENSRTTGCTFGRPPVKPVIAGADISAIGATSRENSSSASFSGWRTPTLRTTSRDASRACGP